MSYNINQMNLLSMTIKKIVFCALLSFVVLFPLATLAADPVPLRLEFAPPCIPSPGVLGLDTCAAPLTANSTIQDYLIRLYQFAVGISGIVAVGMIVWGSIQISLFTESITQKSEGREKITSAIIGIVLLLGSYLILSTVNPRIVSLGEMLSTSTVPTNTSTPAALQEPPEECRPAKTIPGTSFTRITGVTPAANNTCRYRRLRVNVSSGGMTFRDVDEYYDLSWVAAYTPLGFLPDITMGSIVWVYPYKKIGQSVETARCLVYAYRGPGTDAGKFAYVGLAKDVEPCTLISPGSKQEPGYLGGSGIINPDGAPGTVPDNIKELAGQLQTFGITFGTGASCSPSESSAAGVLQSLKRGETPYVCSSGCSTNGIACRRDRNPPVFPSLALLYKIDQLSDAGVIATVTSLTGGDHAPNSKHYIGAAFDIVPTTYTISGTTYSGVSAYNHVIDLLNGSGSGNIARCEYKDSSGNTQLKPTCDAVAMGSQNLHIHVELAY